MTQGVFGQVLSVVAVVAAATAMLLWLPGPPRRLARARGDQAGGGVRERWMALLHGRSDGLSRRTRTFAAVAATVAATTIAQSMGLPTWAAWLLALVVGAGAGVGAGWLEDPATRRRRDRVAADLPATCDLLAACLAAGLPLRRAVDVVADAMGGPVADDLRQVTALVATGEPEATAWRGLAGSSPPWRRLAVDLARSVESGTAVVGTLHEHARLTREAAEAVQERRARTAGVRSVLPLMVCFLPAFFLVGVVPIVAGLLLQLLG